MATVEEMISAIEAQIAAGERPFKAFRDANVPAEHRQEVRQAVMENVFKNRMNDLPLEQLQNREAMMMKRLQVISEAIAAKM
jgi:hypothetical protein